jgi:peptide/nickel transport system permease protein
MSKRNYIQKVSLSILLVLAIIGLFHKFIFNDKPFFTSEEIGFSSPIFQDFISDWSTKKFHYVRENNSSDAALPPFPYSYNTINVQQLGAKPPSRDHLLGTDDLGRDVFAGLGRSLHHVIKIGLLATIFSIMLGTIIGFLMAYFKNDQLKLSIINVIICLIGLGLILFYLKIGYLGFAILCLGAAILSLYLLRNLNWFIVNIPVQSMFDTLINVRKSIPGIIIFLCLLPTASEYRSVFMIIVMSLVGWTSIAWLVRNEVKLIMTQDYYIAAKSMGLGFWRSMTKHVFPNLKHLLISLFGFQLINVALIESSLTFLGIGIAADDVSFGTLLYQAKEDISSWWLAVFPGLLLSIILICIHQLIKTFKPNEF